MIIHKSDITIAHYFSGEEISFEEIEQADIIQIRSFVDKGIYHPNSIIWRGYINPSLQPKDFVRSKKERKNIVANQNYFKNKGYSIKTIPLTRTIYQEFIEIYKNTVAKKKRVIEVEAKQTINNILELNKPIYCTGLFYGGKLKSALIFHIKNSTAMVALGAKEKFTKIRGGIGGLLELELLDYCIKNNIREISHGKSLNPVGLISSSGLFEFKARYGFTAFPVDYWVTSFIKNPQFALADIIFLTPYNNNLSYLIISDSPIKELQKRYKTKEIENIRVISTQEAKKMTTDFLNSIKK